MKEATVRAVTYEEWCLLRYFAGLHGARTTSTSRPQESVYEDGSTSLGYTKTADRVAYKLAMEGVFLQRESERSPVFGISPAGLRAARGPQPQRRVPKPPALNERDFEVLHELTRSWETPMQFGARNGSHHSASAMKLVRHGYAETKQRGDWVARSECGPDAALPSLFGRRRGSRVYRITDAGEKALTIWREARRRTKARP